MGKKTEAPPAVSMGMQPKNGRRLGATLAALPWQPLSRSFRNLGQNAFCQLMFSQQACHKCRASVGGNSRQKLQPQNSTCSTLTMLKYGVSKCSSVSSFKNSSKDKKHKIMLTYFNCTIFSSPSFSMGSCKETAKRSSCHDCFKSHSLFNPYLFTLDVCLLICLN